MTLDPNGRRVTVGPVSESRDRSWPAQGYRLEVADDGIRLMAADEAGARHGRATLAQLTASTGGTVPATEPAGATVPVCVIEDWPDFAVRAVMLDIARDRVPTLETVFALIDQLAG